LAEPPEGGELEGAGHHAFESEITVTAIPNPGYDFVNWTEGEDPMSICDNVEYTFIVLEDRTLTANFAIQYYDIDLIATPEEYGEVEGDGNYHYGQVITVDAIPNDTYVFVKWTEDGEEIPDAGQNYTFTVDGPRTLTAHFALATYEVTLFADPPDGGELYGAKLYPYGEIVTVVAIANDDYNFINWTQGGIEVSTNIMHSFTITEDVELVAHFELKNAIETVNADGIKVYPNPTSGQLKITTSDYQISDMRLFDITGRQMSVVGQSEIGQSEIAIDLSHLESGIYFLRIQTENGAVTKKIIKN